LVGLEDLDPLLRCSGGLGGELCPTPIAFRQNGRDHQDSVFGGQQGGQEKGRFCSTAFRLTFVPGKALADEFAQSCR